MQAKGSCLGIVPVQKIKKRVCQAKTCEQFASNNTQEIIHSKISNISILIF